MQLRVEQLQEHLQHTLAPVYLIAGDEPLQVMEAADAIRKVALERGFTERELWHVDNQFDWNRLYEEVSSLSLFSSRKLLDIRLPSCKVGTAAAKALQHYLAQAPSDKILLIQTAKLDKACRDAAWIKKIEQQGVLLSVWELNTQQTVAWIAKRMRTAGLKPNEEAVRYLAERVEGNLLAAAQEINKLVLLFGNQPLTAEQLKAVVTDSARYGVFDLVDAILLADLHHLQHVLKILQEEDTALPLVVWALADLLRQLYTGCENQKNGISNQSLLVKMPKARQAAWQKALRPLQTSDWPALFAHIALLDQYSKGVGRDVAKHPQRFWDTVMELALQLTGRTLWAV